MFSISVFGVEDIKRGAGRVNRMRERFKGAPSTIIRRAGKVVLDSMRENIPVAEEDEIWQYHDREHARDVIEFHINGGKGNLTGPSYLKYVIEGSDAHTPLVFVNSDGDTVWAMRSETPSRDGNDFRKPAWEESRDEVRSIMHEVGMKIAKDQEE